MTSKLKGGSYVVDNCSDTDHSVAPGIGEQLLDGRVCSHPAGSCHHHGAGQRHSGAKTFKIKEGFLANLIENRKTSHNVSIMRRLL